MRPQAAKHPQVVLSQVVLEVPESLLLEASLNQEVFLAVNLNLHLAGINLEAFLTLQEAQINLPLEIRLDLEALQEVTVVDQAAVQKDPLFQYQYLFLGDTAIHIMAG